MILYAHNVWKFNYSALVFLVESFSLRAAEIFSPRLNPNITIDHIGARILFMVLISLSFNCTVFTVRLGRTSASRLDRCQVVGLIDTF